MGEFCYVNTYHKNIETNAILLPTRLIKMGWGTRWGMCLSLTADGMKAGKRVLEILETELVRLNRSE